MYRELSFLNFRGSLNCYREFTISSSVAFHSLDFSNDSHAACLIRSSFILISIIRWRRIPRCGTQRSWLNSWTTNSWFLGRTRLATSLIRSLFSRLPRLSRVSSLLEILLTSYCTSFRADARPHRGIRRGCNVQRVI